MPGGSRKGHGIGLRLVSVPECEGSLHERGKKEIPESVNINPGILLRHTC